MEYALKSVPVAEYPPPEGVVNQGGEWYYTEYARGGGVARLGGSSHDPNAGGTEQQPAPGDSGFGAPGPDTQPSEEKKRILDLFKN